MLEVLERAQSIYVPAFQNLLVDVEAGEKLGQLGADFCPLFTAWSASVLCCPCWGDRVALWEGDADRESFFSLGLQLWGYLHFWHFSPLLPQL